MAASYGLALQRMVQRAVAGVRDCDDAVARTLEAVLGSYAVKEVLFGAARTSWGVASGAGGDAAGSAGVEGRGEFSLFDREGLSAAGFSVDELIAAMIQSL